jgi:hypothetical protein
MPLMLVYGSTGRAGRMTCERALQQGWQVVCFARNPSKVLPALQTAATIFKGDLNDRDAVMLAVKTHRPQAIVDASSALPFGHAKGQPANTADRSILLKATFEALKDDGRLHDCVFVMVGGQVIPEPGGQINNFFAASISCLLKTFAAAAWRQVLQTVKWLFEEADGFRFIMARMGYMVEEPTKGSLRAEATHNNVQRGAVSYVDVADALVRLAGDDKRTWERQAIYFNYQ